jgi:GntR family transcriptional repressor for pyruvate dehydrogenase complex
MPVNQSSERAATQRAKPQGSPPKAFRAIKRLTPRASRVEQVVERIRKGIYDGEFPPGSELPAEGKLAEMVGVSYTVIREAMRILRTHGLVEISQGRRPRVKPAGPDAVKETLDAMLRRSSSSIRELTELRQPLECEMAALAAQRATPEQIEQIEAAFSKQLTAKTLEEQIEADIEFHNCLAGAAGNQLFGLVLSILWDLLWESRRRGILHYGGDSSFQAHQKIVEAVKRRDSDDARRIMAEHLAGFETLWRELNEGGEAE